MKRLFDFIVSLVALIVFSPLLILLAGLVKFTSKGSVFYTQARLGRGMRPFFIFKFRSMTDTPKEQTRKVTIANDSRITSLGRFLRKYRLDELPQLWNILRGDMSFVGPRPEVPEYAKHYPDEFKRICSVRPGLAGITQLRFINEEKVLSEVENPEEFYINELLPQKLASDLDYVENRSFFGDVRILIQTFFALFASSAVNKCSD